MRCFNIAVAKIYKSVEWQNELCEVIENEPFDGHAVKHPHFIENECLEETSDIHGRLIVSCIE